MKKFRPCQKVVCVDDDDSGGSLKNGQVYEVKDVADGMVDLFDADPSGFYYDFRFVSVIGDRNQRIERRLLRPVKE